jgi:carbon storage regulator
MLVLARKASETIQIGENITVKVLSIRGGQVKLGIEAPSGVRVSRGGPGGRTSTPATGAKEHTEGTPAEQS